jgi:transposase
MKRTRKFALMQQEAMRLTAIGMTPREIAAHLEVNKSTVTRWIAAGKLPATAVSNVVPITPAQARMAPAEWAKSVREEYRLDATDDALVTLAEWALSLARDNTASAAVQLSAAGRFQAIVRQLALVTRRAAAEVPAPVAVNDTPKRPVLVRRRTAAHDPRKVLMRGIRGNQ